MGKRTSRRTAAVLTIVAGICVLVFPDLLKWIIGLLLIIHGLLNLR